MLFQIVKVVDLAWSVEQIRYAATIGNGIKYAVLHKPAGAPKCRNIVAYNGFRLVNIGAIIPAIR